MDEKKLNILIVDDNPEIRNILKLECKAAEMNSRSVATEHGAIIALKEESFDWILLDILLNDGAETSLKVLEYLKSSENKLNDGLRVIILSGIADKDFKERNKDKVTKIISKPFDMNELIEFIKNE